MAQTRDALPQRQDHDFAMRNKRSNLTESLRSATWARVSAVVYDPFLWVGECVGLRTQRKELLRRARGYTVEIGSGTGLNLRYYPDGIDELVLTEPDAPMRSRLEKRLRTSGRRAQLLDTPAEHLPFADGSVDTVVSTFVLCTVDAPDLTLREVVRVLRPDGQLLFIEHVRSDSPTLASWQDHLAELWHGFTRGCRCNQATAALIVSSGLQLEAVGQASWHAMPPIVRPLVIGRASHGTSVATPAHSSSAQKPLTN
jgi:SAM-dependent methyltransferase